MAAYTVARLDEIEEWTDGRQPWRPIRHHLGITAFGINTWTARNAGDQIINEHDEAEEMGEEVYLVLEGRAVFEVDGERLDATPGTFVFVQPGIMRTAFAEEPETTIVAVGGFPGKPYRADGWEIWAPLRPLYNAGDYEGVIERGRELIEASPQYAEPVYNLACCESLTGRTAEALEHLRQAIARSEHLREYAKTDSDFDPIRDDPSFKELVGG